MRLLRGFERAANGGFQLSRRCRALRELDCGGGLHVVEFAYAGLETLVQQLSFNRADEMKYILTGSGGNEVRLVLSRLVEGVKGHVARGSGRDMRYLDQDGLLQSGNARNQLRAVAVVVFRFRRVFGFHLRAVLVSRRVRRRAMVVFGDLRYIEVNGVQHAFECRLVQEADDEVVVFDVSWFVRLSRLQRESEEA